MFACQRQYSRLQKHHGQRTTIPVGAEDATPSSHGSVASTIVVGDDLSSNATECSSPVSGCLGNVMAAAKCLDKRSTTTEATTTTSSCISEPRTARRRQRRRRRPVYFGNTIASVSPDCSESGRRRRPVQPWHIQQQAACRLSEVQYQLANLSATGSNATSYGNGGAQHPVTLVDSSWWPVSSAGLNSVCIMGKYVVFFLFLFSGGSSAACGVFFALLRN